jgi:hypothetical protein
MQYIFPNSHVNGYQNLNQKVHERDAIDTPPEHISIKMKEITNFIYSTLRSPIMQ